jgi:hypothetical protein
MTRVRNVLPADVLPEPFMAVPETFSLRPLRAAVSR